MSGAVFLVAAEPSGDLLGAEVIDALRALSPQVVIGGVGGEAMRERGANSPIDLSDLAVLGLIDGLKAFLRVKQKVEDVAREIQKRSPQAVVLIDSWGFMWRLAKRLKQLGLPAARIKLIGPQVWATRPGRAKVLAKWCDHLLCIHAFEQPFYERYGLATTVIGNPAIARIREGDGAAYRKAHYLASDAPIIGILPGSRRSELRRVGPVLAEAAKQLCAQSRDRRVVCVAATPVREQVLNLASRWTFPNIVVADDAEKADAFAAMDVALACSGTVTTEVASQGAALVVGYKLGWITWLIARLFLMRSPYITLLNVAAGSEIAPEFVQTRFTASNLVQAVGTLLSDPDARKRQKQKQSEALDLMKGPGRPAAEIAAETILALAQADSDFRPV